MESIVLDSERFREIFVFCRCGIKSLWDVSEAEGFCSCPSHTGSILGWKHAGL